MWIWRSSSSCGSFAGHKISHGGTVKVVGGSAHRRCRVPKPASFSHLCLGRLLRADSVQKRIMSVPSHGYVTTDAGGRMLNQVDEPRYHQIMLSYRDGTWFDFETCSTLQKGVGASRGKRRARGTGTLLGAPPATICSTNNKIIADTLTTPLRNCMVVDETHGVLGDCCLRLGRRFLAADEANSHINAVLLRYKLAAWQRLPIIPPNG